MLPQIKEYGEISNSENKMLIVSEGFEMRSLAWLKSLEENVIFEDAIICEYSPTKKSKYKEVLSLVQKHTRNNPITLKYDRFEPTIFETELRKYFSSNNKYDDIYIDISVMSKLLIMIITNELQQYEKSLHFIYSEPVSWGPTQQQYEEALREKKNGGLICLSSIGVGDIVRTPALSSIVMQGNPVVLIAGLSFNEQIVNILVNNINPEKVFFINQGCQRDTWREEAIEEIHRGILDEYSHQKKIMEKFLLTEYDKVFEFLVEIYKKYWLTSRIVLSPTGYKMHAISFSLMKICCPDIHIEYPTPDSYLFDGYSSDEVQVIYELEFENFADNLRDIYDDYRII